jgi:hypothetical protein
MFALAVVLALGASAALASDEDGPEIVYFDATGHYVGGEFLQFWLEFGGIQTFGYPLSSEIEQDGVIVQYFERHVLELHVDDDDEEEIQLRKLGIEAMNDRNLAHRWPFEPQDDDGDGTFFENTSQSMSGVFLQYWRENGGSTVFGDPISTRFRHFGTRVQFTEYAILEHHPDNPREWRVLPELLGSEAAERDGIDTSPLEHDDETERFNDELWQEPDPPGLPAELRIARIGVVAEFEHLGRTPAGAMADPEGWDNVSWFNEGPRPGEQGNAAVAGHLDRPGGSPAIFWNLRQLRPGDHVTVITEDGEELVFEVTEVEQFYVEDAPNRKIFGRTDDYNMNLITCAGSWDRSIGMYDQRLVAYTTLVTD